MRIWKRKGKSRSERKLEAFAEEEGREILRLERIEIEKRWIERDVAAFDRFCDDIRAGRRTVLRLPEKEG